MEVIGCKGLGNPQPKVYTLGHGALGLAAAIDHAHRSPLIL
jgi:hypothetical protein